MSQRLSGNLQEQVTRIEIMITGNETDSIVTIATGAYYAFIISSNNSLPTIAYSK